MRSLRIDFERGEAWLDGEDLLRAPMADEPDGGLHLGEARIGDVVVDVHVARSLAYTIVMLLAPPDDDAARYRDRVIAACGEVRALAGTQWGVGGSFAWGRIDLTIDAWDEYDGPNPGVTLERRHS
jgi:hypothetical protein